MLFCTSAAADHGAPTSSEELISELRGTQQQPHTFHLHTQSFPPSPKSVNLDYSAHDFESNLFCAFGSQPSRCSSEEYYSACCLPSSPISFDVGFDSPDSLSDYTPPYEFPSTNFVMSTGAFSSHTSTYDPSDPSRPLMDVHTPPPSSSSQCGSEMYMHSPTPEYITPYMLNASATPYGQVVPPFTSGPSNPYTQYDTAALPEQHYQHPDALTIPGWHPAYPPAYPEPEAPLADPYSSAPWSDPNSVPSHNTTSLDEWRYRCTTPRCGFTAASQEQLTCVPLHHSPSLPVVANTLAESTNKNT